jgi:hypothetical protein
MYMDEHMCTSGTGCTAYCIRRATALLLVALQQPVRYAHKSGAGNSINKITDGEPLQHCKNNGSATTVS